MLLMCDISMVDMTPGSFPFFHSKQMNRVLRSRLICYDLLLSFFFVFIYYCGINICVTIILYIFNCYSLTYFVYLNLQKIAKKESLIQV